MAFLLAKILVLLLLAGLFGAGFARWYLRRRYEDVTVQYSSWQSDWSNWRRQLERRFAEPAQGLDLSPVMARLDDLEATVRELRGSSFSSSSVAADACTARDLEPLAQRLRSIEASLAALAAASSGGTRA